MSLKQRIEQDFVTAYKARDTVRVAVLRQLKTAIKNREVELLRQLEDPDVLDVVARQIKQRKESVEQFSAAGRKDLADAEALEAEVLTGYMPAALPDHELADLIDKTVADLQASGMKDMGRVMQTILAGHKGRVDGKKLSELVKARLAS